MNRREFLAAVPTAAVCVSGATAAGPTGPPPLRPGETPWPTAAEVQAYAEASARAEESRRPLFSDLRFVVATHDDSKIDLPLHEFGRGPGLVTVALDDSTLDRNHRTMQGRRGLGGAPLRAWRFQPTNPPPAPGRDDDAPFRYADLFGCYGEYLPVTEWEWSPTRGAAETGPDRRQVVWWKVRGLVARRYDRYEWALWKLLAGGPGFVHPAGVHVVGPNPRWTEPDADPLGMAGYFRAHSHGGVSFDGRAPAYLNYKTADVLCQRLGLPTEPTGLADAATDAARALWRAFDDTFQARLDAATAGWGGPRFVRFGQGYLDERGDFRPFVPDGRVIVFGRRETAEPVGAYLNFKNANNPDIAPGPYTRLVHRVGDDGSREVHDGHNGGAVLYFPSAMVVMNV